jgi:hypothetical protein
MQLSLQKKMSSDFSAEKQKRNKQKRKQEFEAGKGLFCENGHRDGTRLSDGIVA